MPMRLMRNAGGYVKVYRSILDWEWYDDDACVRLMLHLILSVNWETKEWHGQQIAPGQMVTSMEGLAGKLRLSRSAIRRAMDKLKSTGEVTIQSNNHWTTVTLANWGEYQEAQPTAGRQKSQPTADQQPTTDRPPATTKEGKKERREEGKKSPKGDSADRRDPQVSDVVEFFEQQLGATLDGSARENRWRAKSLLNRMAKEYPGFDPVVSVKALVKAARDDEFHSKNATSFDYLLRKCRAIIEAKESREKNPKTQSDEQYREAAREEAIRRFGGR